MMASDAARAVLVSAAAVCVTLDLAPAVYVLALLAVVAGSPFRAAQAGLVPQLVHDPEELTSSNAVSSNLENIMIFVGPALGALLVGAFNVETAMWLNVATYGWSFLMVAGIKVPPRGDASAARTAATKGVSCARRSRGSSSSSRTRTCASPPLLAATQGILFGALTVLNVIIAIEMLDAGPTASATSWPSAASAACRGDRGARAGRPQTGRHRHDGRRDRVGTAVPPAGGLPSPVTAVIALLVVGFMDPWVNLGLDTLPQRLAEERMMSRVFATVDASLIAAMAVGSVIAPVLLHLLGLRGALLAMGAVAAAYAVTTLPRMRRLDQRLQAPPDTDLLRGIAMFAPLASSSVEGLAVRASAGAGRPGEVVVTEGEPAHEFFVIVAGEVEVTHDGARAGREGPGEVFGEIGLLRNVPRTATVTAVTDVELWALDRDDFLGAVTGTGAARVAAEDIVSRRIAT